MILNIGVASENGKNRTLRMGGSYASGILREMPSKVPTNEILNITR
jgi:hypothetical protein